MPTDTELLRAAFQALLKGDYKKRDEYCARIQRRIDARQAEDVKLAQAAEPYFTKH